jgi:hypothetical protein
MAMAKLFFPCRALPLKQCMGLVVTEADFALDPRTD